jgi:hypothetical protein
MSLLIAIVSFAIHPFQLTLTQPTVEPNPVQINMLDKINLEKG